MLARALHVNLSEERRWPQSSWFCGKPNRKYEPAESLPGGTCAVHARCAERDIASGGNRSGDDASRKAA